MFSAFCDTSGMTCCNTAEAEETAGAGRSAGERSSAGDAWGAKGGVALSFTGFGAVGVESERLDTAFAPSAEFCGSLFEEAADSACDEPAALRSRGARVGATELRAGSGATFGDAADVVEGAGRGIARSVLDCAGAADSPCPIRAATASTGPSE